jgi:hypothetical protein
MHNWDLLYTTTNLNEAAIVKGMLEENSIQVILLNKMASSYINFGEVELYVPLHLRDIARLLLNNSLLN